MPPVENGFLSMKLVAHRPHTWMERYYNLYYHFLNHYNADNFTLRANTTLIGIFNYKSHSHFNIALTIGSFSYSYVNT